MSSGKALLGAAGVTVVVAVGLSLLLSGAEPGGLGTVVLVVGLALAAILLVTGVIALRTERRDASGDERLP